MKLLQKNKTACGNQGIRLIAANNEIMKIKMFVAIPMKLGLLKCGRHAPQWRILNGLFC